MAMKLMKTATIEVRDDVGELLDTIAALRRVAEAAEAYLAEGDLSKLECRANTDGPPDPCPHERTVQNKMGEMRCAECRKPFSTVPATGKLHEHVILPDGRTGIIEASWMHNRVVSDRQCHVVVIETGKTVYQLVSELRTVGTVERSQATETIDALVRALVRVRAIRRCR